MGPIRSGTLGLVDTLRTTAVADTAHPNDTAPTDNATNVGRQVPERHSRDAWIVVRNELADAGVSVTVTLFGSTTGAAGSWRAIGQLNNGGAITPTTNAGIAHTNRIYYAEAMPGALGWAWLYALVTGTLGQSTIVEVYGEIA